MTRAGIFSCPGGAGDRRARLDLAEVRPDSGFVQRAPGVVARTLSHPGKAYVLYLQGRAPTTLSVNLPPGRWTAEWLDIESGRVLKRDTASGKAKEPVALASPEFADAIAVRLSRQ